MPDAIETIRIPPVTYAFGDRRLRVLYGPEGEGGARQAVGAVDEEHVERVQGMLDWADAHMPEGEAPPHPAADVAAGPSYGDRLAAIEARLAEIERTLRIHDSSIDFRVGGGG